MTTDRQRAEVRDYLAERFGPAFEVTVTAVPGFDDEAVVAFPIWTPPGKYTTGRYRYASAVTRFRMDGRKPVTDSDRWAVSDAIDAQMLAGCKDPRYTDQAREDYCRAMVALTAHRSGAGNE